VWEQEPILRQATTLARNRANDGEVDALAISRIIQERHFPHFTLLDPIFDGPASNQIVNYTRCGDSAIWTGHYLAAEAFRYAATRSPDALANARRAFAGIQSLVDVTGNNVLARCLIPDDSPYAQGIQNEEAPANPWKIALCWKNCSPQSSATCGSATCRRKRIRCLQWTEPRNKNAFLA